MAPATLPQYYVADVNITTDVSIYSAGVRFGGSPHQIRYRQFAEPTSNDCPPTEAWRPRRKYTIPDMERDRSMSVGSGDAGDGFGPVTLREAGAGSDRWVLRTPYR